MQRLLGSLVLALVDYVARQLSDRGIVEPVRQQLIQCSFCIMMHGVSQELPGVVGWSCSDVGVSVEDSPSLAVERHVSTTKYGSSQGGMMRHGIIPSMIHLGSAAGPE